MLFFPQRSAKTDIRTYTGPMKNWFQQCQNKFDFGSVSEAPEWSVIDGYGTLVIVTIGGSFPSFSFLPFLITLFTTFGMLKLGKPNLFLIMSCDT